MGSILRQCTLCQAQAIGPDEQMHHFPTCPNAPSGKRAKAEGVQVPFSALPQELKDILAERAAQPITTPPTREDVFAGMAAELDYAYSKHGKALWGRHEFISILREEFEEAWDDIKADAPQEQLNAEIIQIAAMCLRYLETGDKTRGDHPPLKIRSPLPKV